MLGAHRPNRGNLDEVAAGEERGGFCVGMAWADFPEDVRSPRARGMVVGDDGTVTMLDERSATEHHTEPEVSVDSGPASALTLLR